MIDLLPVGTCAYAPTGEILHYNACAVALWGRRPERFDPLERFTGALQLLHRDGTVLPADETPVAIALRTGEPHDLIETILARPDGGRLRVHSRIRVISDEVGTHVAAIEVFHERADVRLDRVRASEDLMRAVREVGEKAREVCVRTQAVRATVKVLDGAVEALVDLSAIARDIGVRFAARARAADSAIHVDADSSIRVIADRIRIDAVLGHVVDSALRQGPGRSVDVRVRRSHASAELWVSTRGLGTTFTVCLPLAP